MKLETRRSSLLLASAAFLACSVGVVAHAAPTTAATDALYIGIVNAHHDTKRGSEFWFEIPADLAVHLDEGDVLEPDDFSQSIVYYGGNIGFCINPGVSAGNAHTTYHFRGARHERALEAARNAEALGEPRDEAVWALIRAEEAESRSHERADSEAERDAWWARVRAGATD
jgi:hypothetical protein